LIARSIFKVLGSIAILAISPPLVSQTKDKPTESETEPVLTV
jgi:hypothetical protein